jgi:hypothetical protein
MKFENIYELTCEQPPGWAEQEAIECPNCGELTLIPQNGNYPMWVCDPEYGGCGREVQF